MRRGPVTVPTLDNLVADDPWEQPVHRTGYLRAAAGVAMTAFTNIPKLGGVPRYHSSNSSCYAVVAHKLRQNGGKDSDKLVLIGSTTAPYPFHGILTNNAMTRLIADQWSLEDYEKRGFDSTPNRVWLIQVDTLKSLADHLMDQYASTV